MPRLRVWVSGLALAVVFTTVWAAPPQWIKSVKPSRDYQHPDIYTVSRLTWPNGAVLDAAHSIQFNELKITFSRAVTAFRYQIVETDQGHRCRQAGMDCENVVVKDLLVSESGGPDHDAILTLNYYSDDNSMSCALNVYPENDQPFTTQLACPAEIATRGKVREQ